MFDKILGLINKFKSQQSKLKQILTLVGIGGLAGSSTFMGSGKWVFLIVLGVLLVLFVGGYLLVKAFRNRKQSARMGAEMSQHSSASPRGISDPGQRARLDDMRKKFDSGVEAYRARGKDLYKLPWYAIVGEPGSGKTEAIRHSNVGFPPGMQDEFQGVGGTINMNWWFTNNAVLLDTAGRLMFEEVKPGETSEWKEFLTLLKKNRPNCPINGLFLVIPSDSLIKDTADSIQAKAGKIAQQLDVIQRVLDVRFPVYIVVTKCDKINGFREFFDGLTDPQLQHQMTGWSNPEPLDEPFRPELVEQHLASVATRLRKRRMGLMRDPVPENPNGRRTDEVDSLYALPHGVELLSSRLRRYLETIFVAGEWSSKPLFLRGIYFSSSMREGSALDQELAEAIGVGVDDLPEGKVWERDRSYFLRDLFLEKVFKEKGLVTRASNTRTMLRSRQIALYGTGFVALAAFIVFAWLGMGTLRNNVKDQADYWQGVSAVGWEQKNWKGAVLPVRPDGSYIEELNTNLVTVAEKKVTLGEFLLGLRDRAEKPLKRNFLFPGLAEAYNRDSKRASRIVVEGAIVRPALAATRQKIARSLTDTTPNQWQPDALVALIQIEADLLSPGKGTNRGILTAQGVTNYVLPLLSFAAKKEVTLDSNVVVALTSAYKAENSWPPNWTTGAPTNAVNTLSNNAAVFTGLNVFLRDATNISAHIANYQQLSGLQTRTLEFEKAEQKLLAAVTAGDDAKFSAALPEVEDAASKLNSETNKAAKLSLFGGKALLAVASQAFEKEVMTSAAGAMTKVKNANDLALKATSGHELFKEISARISEVEKAVAAEMSKLVNSNTVAEYGRLDKQYLADGSFAKRADLYSRAAKLSAETPFATASFDALSRGLYDLTLKKITDLRTEAGTYAGEQKTTLTAISEFALKRTETVQGNAFLAAYQLRAKERLASAVGFPLIRDVTAKMLSPEDFEKARAVLKAIADDLDGTLAKLKVKERDDWKEFIASMATKAKFATALSIEGSFLRCTVSLMPMEDKFREQDNWRETLRRAKLDESDRIDTNNPDKPLGMVTVDRPFIIKAESQDGTKSALLETKQWGPLWAIVKYSGRPVSKADTKTWLVDWPVSDLGFKGAVRLKLDFERPLPDPDFWPSAR